MRILILGAYGFLGREIAGSLARSGHSLVGVGRDVQFGQRLLPQLKWLQADLSRMTSPDKWARAVHDIDVIINSSGLLQRGDGGSVRSVQLDSIAALVPAAESAGVKLFIQISAAGAHLNAPTDFMRTKAEADSLVMASSIPSVVLRPGLVIGRNSYGGTEMIRAAAAAPFSVRLPFRSPVQCVSMDDIVRAIYVAITRGTGADEPIDLVEAQERSIDQIVVEHRIWLQVREPRLAISMPEWTLALISALSDIAGILGWRSQLRRNAMMSLKHGVTGDASATAAFLGTPAMSLDETLAGMSAGKQDRLAARLAGIQPLILIALALLWAASGFATLLNPGRTESILQSGGLNSSSWAWPIRSAAAVDILLAVGLLWRPTARAALFTMLALTAIYLIGGTILLPALWADPLAPLAKAIPVAILTLVTIWLVEKR